MAKPEVNDLLNAGVHFGHLTRKWNPNMAPYIYMERNGIHIINLYKTAAKVEETNEALKKIALSIKLFSLRLHWFLQPWLPFCRD